MEFSVNTEALPGLADLLARRRDDLDAGRSFLTKYGPIDEWDQGILNAARGTHERVVAAIEEFLFGAAWRRADTYSDAVIKATSYYLHTDATAAASLDASHGVGTHDDGYPGLPHPPADQHTGPAVFAETTCGADYVEPHDYRFDYDPISGPWDIVSQTNWARTAVWGVTKLLTDLGLLDRPIDPMQEFCEKLSGDWAAFRRCSDVFQMISVRLALNADWVEHGAGVIPLAWTGNAASACRRALDVFAADLRQAAQTIHNAAINYQEAAEQMKEMTAALAGVLTFIFDYCTDPLLDLTGDPELLLIKDGFDLLRLVHKIQEARRIIGAMIELVKCFSETTSVVGTGLGAVGEIGPLTLTDVSTTVIPGGRPGGRYGPVPE